MLSRLNMKEIDMENLFEEQQRLGHISLKPATSISTILAQHDDDDEHLTISKDSSSSETHDEDELNHRMQQVKTGNLLTTISTKSPSPLTPSPSPTNESLLQILANQMLKTKQQETSLLKIASPNDNSTLKRNYDDEAAMTLLSLNKPPPPAPSAPEALQSVINGFLRKPNPPKATIDYHSTQGENFHNNNSFDQWKALMNYFSMPPTQPPSNIIHSQQHEPRGDMMPLKLRMKMLHAKS